MITLLSKRHFQRYQALLSPYQIEVTDDPSASPIWLAEPALAAQALQQGHRPRWIASVYAGVDALLHAPLPEGIQITNIREVFGPLMAQYVFAHLLSTLRQLPRYQAAQQQQQWQPKGYGSLKGQTLAIAGTGNIGQYIAKVAHAFEMNVVGINTNGRQTEGFDDCYPVDQLSSAVSQADAVVAILPSTAATNRLFNAEVFAQMRDSATFINVGRGNCVDSSALIDALTQGQIAHAVLDVFEQEPLPPQSPLWHCPNLTITPHIAAASFPEQVVEQFVENWQRHRDGVPLQYLVDPVKGY